MKYTIALNRAYMHEKNYSMNQKIEKVHYRFFVIKSLFILRSNIPNYYNRSEPLTVLFHDHYLQFGHF